MNYLAGNITSLKSALLPGIDDAIELAHSSNITLALENIQDWVDEIFFNTPVNMAGFLRDISNPVFGCTLDLMHAQYPGVLQDFVESLSADIVNIHAADLFLPTQRVPVGKGVIDWDHLAAKLQSLPNLRQITVELSNPQANDILESVKFMATLMS